MQRGFWKRKKWSQPRLVPQTADTAEVYRRMRTAFAERVRSVRNTLDKDVTTVLSTIANDLGSSGNCVNAIPASQTQIRQAVVQAHTNSIENIQKAAGTASVMSGNLETLAQGMSTAEVWSKTDADRKLVENQTAKEEADAFPPASWPRFVLAIATTFFGLGSAAITWEEVSHTVPSFSWIGLLLAVPIVVPYAVGFFLAFLSLREMFEDDRKRRETYHYLFGGRKYSIREPALEGEK